MNNQIDSLLKSLSRDFSGVLQTLETLEKIDVIPFGIKTLDEITGVGGVPRGRITELFGAESSGKSSLCLALVAEAQKQGLKCAYIDMELSMTKELALKMGVDLGALLYAQPVTGEDALDLVDKLLENDVKLVVVDSVSSLVPEDELEAKFDEQSIGLQARLMSKGMRKLLGTVKSNNAALVFINQVRDEINKMGFGDKKTTSGGRALRFYASLRLEVARTGWITKNDEKVGLTVKVTTKKNKMSRPQLSSEFSFFFDKGFDKDSDLLGNLLAQNKIKLVGRTYYFNDVEIGNKENAIEYVKINKII